MSLQLVSSLIALSIAGASIAVFLIWKHISKSKQIVCPLNHDCSKVTESKWSTVFGFRNEQLGLAFFVSIFASAILSLVYAQYAQTLYLLNLLASAGAALSAVFLIYIQKSKIKDYCFYCLTSSLIIFLVLANNILLYLGF